MADIEMMQFQEEEERNENERIRIKEEELRKSETKGKKTLAKVGNKSGISSKEQAREKVEIDTKEMFFMPTFHLNFDYCMVLKLEEELGFGYKHTIATKNLFRRLQHAEIMYFPYLNMDKTKLFLLIRCSLESLRSFAEKMKTKMLLDPDLAEKWAAEGCPECDIAPFTIKHNPKVSQYTPFRYIYSEYRRTHKLGDSSEDLPINEDIYWRPDQEEHPFRDILRLKLTYHILSAPLIDGGCALDLNTMRSDGDLITMYPLHDHKYARELLKRWIGYTVFPWSQPFSDINEYFGEKVALYFVFMSTYSVFLGYPAAVGLCFQILVTATSDFSHPVLPFFGVYISIWARTFVRNWDRVERTMSMRWGTQGLVQSDDNRAEYKGDPKPSPVTGKTVLLYPEVYRTRKSYAAWAFVWLTCALAMVSISVLYLFRYYLIHIDEDPSQNIRSDRNFVERSPIARYSLFLVSVLNGAQSHFYNVGFTFIGMWLTDFENHRTAQMYEDALIAKSFTFMSINSYASYFYIAFCWPFEIDVDIFFVHGHTINITHVPNATNFTNVTLGANETWAPTMKPTRVPTMAPTANFTQLPAPVFSGILEGARADHMMTLALNWGVIFIARAILQAATEVLIPFGLLKLHHRSIEALELPEPPTPPEMDFFMEEESLVFANIQTYGDACMQFGYMSFFVTAIPGASVLVLVQNIYKYKADAWRTVKLCRRPIPESTETIGAWKECFSFLSYIAVITNAALITFSMTILDTMEYSLLAKFWIFIGFQWVIFGIHYTLALFEKPNEEVNLQLERGVYISDKLIHKVPDVDNDLDPGEMVKEHDAPYEVCIDGYHMVPLTDISAYDEAAADRAEKESKEEETDEATLAKTMIGLDEEDPDKKKRKKKKPMVVMRFPEVRKKTADGLIILKEDKW